MSDEATGGTILYLDRDAEASAPFLELARRFAAVEVYPSLDQLFTALHDRDGATVLLDWDTLRDTPTSALGGLRDLRGRVPMAAVAGQPYEDHFSDLRRWGILQVGVKAPPLDDFEFGLFLRSVRAPIEGFGLLRYMANTCQVHSLAIRTIHGKIEAIERAINHFATIGFNIHELYDVRLTLEELCNNALFHAFRTPGGAEKYSIREFMQLDDGESVRLDFGSDGATTGFAVTDSSGSLPVRVILAKLERHFNREGLLDDSGRGLYLTRMLSSQMIVNIERGRRTQFIVLFDDRRKSPRPKPFVVNYVGTDTFDEWGIDPDFD
ncbi:MAG: ATP-binding protein [Candidatus Sumerlaeia bacterium]|nr:ATP-binding protein [Candidatus Sumerlaeia bacterium]